MALAQFMTPLDTKHKTTGVPMNHSMPQLTNFLSQFNSNFTSSASTSNSATSGNTTTITNDCFKNVSSLHSFDLKITKQQPGFATYDSKAVSEPTPPPSPVAGDTCVIKKIKNALSSATLSSMTGSGTTTMSTLTSTTTTTTTSLSSAQQPSSLQATKSLLTLLTKETTLVNSTVHTPATTPTSCVGGSGNLFIDPFDLRNKLARLASQANELAHNFFIVLLDCRSFSDFNSKRIKDSVHLNCRDKINKKRLLTRKITVKDLIASESVKSKFGGCGGGENSSADTDENLIIIYDDMTSDADELQSESNPLKIVSDNIKQTGLNNDCKILKGGFKQFCEICPEYVEEVLKLNSANSKYYDAQPDQHQSSIDHAQMTMIEPYLYLGNQSDARNVRMLENEGIFHVLNVTKNIPFYDEELPAELKDKFVFKRIAVNDAINQDLRQHFAEAFKFIDDAVANNSKVLVHCQAGVSRSPTIVIAYLMRKLKLKMNDAYGKVREKRPIVAPNLIFMSQLMDFELSLFKEQPPQPAIADITMNSSDSMVIDCETTETRVHA